MTRLLIKTVLMKTKNAALTFKQPSSWQIHWRNTKYLPNFFKRTLNIHQHSKTRVNEYSQNWTPPNHLQFPLELAFIDKTHASTITSLIRLSQPVYFLSNLHNKFWLSPLSRDSQIVSFSLNRKESKPKVIVFQVSPRIAIQDYYPRQCWWIN